MKDKVEPKGISPAEMAAKIKDAAPAKTTSKAAVATSTAVAGVPPTTDEAAEKQANTLADKIAKSGYMWHQNQVSGREFIGGVEDECKINRCKHLPLAEVEARAGMEVHPSKGSAFAIPSDFPRGLGPSGWLAVVDGGGKSLFA